MEGQSFNTASDRQQREWVAQWQLCIDGIEELAGLFRYWDPQYSRFTDPMVSCIIWVGCIMLTLHSMSTSYQQGKVPGQGDSIQESLGVLTIALQGFSRYWPIAKLLLRL